jgi:hypothetical protein
VDEIYVSRLLDAVEDELQVQVNRKTPWFFDMGLQTFRRPKRPVENAEANSVLVDYLLRRVKNGANIVFCEQRGAVEFYRRHYQENPEVVDYDANFNCGVKAYDSNTGAWMPVNYPDVMEIENSRYTAWFKKGEGMLPSYHWDYMKPWHYPDWGNTTLTRSLIGTLIPGEHDKFAVTPLITDTRKMKAAREEKDVDGALEITVQLETPVALNGFPLALWDIPREWKPGDGWWRAHGDARFIPVRAPFTGNLCGILEVVARPGRNEYRVRIGTTRREPRSQDITVDGLEAKVFQRDGRSMAYLWPMHPWDTTIEITVPPGREVQFYAAPEGERVDLKTGANTLVVPKEKWARVVGLSRLELAAALRTIP